MTDKNGTEIKTGDIVEITGAYFKNDNGLYLVDRSPGDPSWTGSAYSLKKISRAGKLSTAKNRIGFWPIAVFISDHFKSAEARRWNSEHATIEVQKIQNMAGVAAHFQELADNTTEYIERRLKWELGEGSPVIEQYRAIAAHHAAVAQRVMEG